MKKALFTVFLTCLFVPLWAHGQAGPEVWESATQAAFDPEKAAAVSGLTMQRDRIHITLQQGTIQFSKPLAGRVYAAAFRGTGKIRVEPPNAREAQQLRFFAGQDILDMEFTEAVFSFNDRTFEEVAGTLPWSATTDTSLEKLYRERQSFREDEGAEVLPRLVKAILAKDSKQNEFFYAELKTAQKGWLVATLDSTDPEEVGVGRWVSYRGWGRDTWMSFPRNGQESAVAWNNPLARETVLIDSYRIAASVTQGAELECRVSLKFRPQWDGEQVLVFVLDSNLRASAVRLGSTGQELQFRQPQERKERVQSYGDYIAVFLPEPLVAGKEYELEFQYGGKRVVRTVGPGAFFAQSFGWYPAIQNFAARSMFDLTFRFPKKYELVASAKLVSDTQDGNDRITAWKTQKPVAVAGFAYGEIKIEKSSAGNVEVMVYANRHADDAMRTIARIGSGEAAGPSTLPSAARERTGLTLGNLTPATMAGEIAVEMANAIRTFDVYFGPYPYDQLAVSTIPYSYGQGWPGLIYLSALSFLDPVQQNQLGIRGRSARELTDFFRAHETSHQWWGHKVAWKSYHDQWLSEGFAEFSGNLYLQLRSGLPHYLDRLREARKAFALRDDNGHAFDSVGPIWMGLRLSSTESPRAYAQLVYEKGGFVLHMLRMMLMDPQSADPEAKFKAMMRDFTQTYDNQAASTEDFKAVAEKHMIPDMNLDGDGRLDWFFNQYVYGTGIPEYQFSYTLTDAGDGQWKLNGEVKQSGVPSGWKDVLPLYMEVNKNVYRVGTINVMEPVVKFEQVLPFKPEKVVLCQNEDTIGNIKQ